MPGCVRRSWICVRDAGTRAACAECSIARDGDARRVAHRAAHAHQPRIRVVHPGDTNRNASVQVSFRKTGTGDWKPALPLLRLQGERIDAESRVDVIAPNMFAGSILDLEPDSRTRRASSCRIRRACGGPAERIVTVRTRAEPQPYAGGRVFHVYPHGFKGQKTEPSFEGLMCAYNYWCEQYETVPVDYT